MKITILNNIGMIIHLILFIIAMLELLNYVQYLYVEKYINQYHDLENIINFLKLNSIQHDNYIKDHNIRYNYNKNYIFFLNKMKRIEYNLNKFNHVKKICNKYYQHIDDIPHVIKSC